MYANSAQVNPAIAEMKEADLIEVRRDVIEHGEQTEHG